MKSATLPASVLTKHQVKVYGPKIYTEGGETYKLTATVRYDDQCGNGHNSFGITGAQYRKNRFGRWEEDSFGCIHDEIVKHFPELASYIKWHLCSSDGPMHYVANTIYHAQKISKDQGKWFVYLGIANPKVNELLGIFSTDEYQELKNKLGEEYLTAKPYENSMAKEPNLEAARSCAIWPDATLDDLQDKDKLEARLPGLVEEFKQAVESLGFIF